MAVSASGWAQPEPTRPWHYYRAARLDGPSACGVWAFDPSIDGAPAEDPPEGAPVCGRCLRAVEAEERRQQWIGNGAVIRWRATSQIHGDGPGPWRWHTAVVQQVQSYLILPTGRPIHSIEPWLSVYWARRACAISLQVLELGPGDCGPDLRWIAIHNPDLPACEWERSKAD